MLRWLRTRRYREALRETPPIPLLWSKGIARWCDYKGPETYWLEPTESCQSEAFFREHFGAARGVVWVRLGTRSRDGARCDLDNFVRAALPAMTKPFALITTDGDVSVPGELNPDTVERLLSCPFLVSWHSQNFDGDARQGKLSGFPIGLDLHTPRRGTNPLELARLLEAIRAARAPVDTMPLRVFCDFNVSLVSDERRRAVAALKNCDHVDFLKSRIDQAAIWRRYAQYPFVLSAIGNGMDCHRTWELLYLGCIVITKTSPLDGLFDGFPVAIVEDWDAVRDLENLKTWLGRYGGLTGHETLWKRLEPAMVLGPIRQGLQATI